MAPVALLGAPGFAGSPSRILSDCMYTWERTVMGFSHLGTYSRDGEGDTPLLIIVAPSACRCTARACTGPGYRFRFRYQPGSGSSDFSSQLQLFQLRSRIPPRRRAHPHVSALRDREPETGVEDTPSPASNRPVRRAHIRSTGDRDRACPHTAQQLQLLGAARLGAWEVSVSDGGKHRWLRCQKRRLRDTTPSPRGS